MAHRLMQGLADLGQCFVDQGQFDGMLARQVFVDGGRLDAELGAEPAHGQGVGSFRLEQSPARGDDFRGAGAERTRPGRCAWGGIGTLGGIGTRGGIGARGGNGPRHASGSMTNTGCLGAMRAISSSVESALTPSKNTPTSAFQRRR